MLKSTFLIKHNIAISKFAKFISFIRIQNTGYKPKKFNIFKRKEVNKFLIEALDVNYLMWQVMVFISFYHQSLLTHVFFRVA